MRIRGHSWNHLRVADARLKKVLLGISWTAAFQLTIYTSAAGACHTSPSRQPKSHAIFWYGKNKNKG